MQALAGEIYISPTRVASALKAVIEITRRNPVSSRNRNMTPKTAVLSLVTSTGGVTQTPLHVKLMLPSSVVIRRLQKRGAGYRTGALLQPIEHVGARQNTDAPAGCPRRKARYGFLVCAVG
jgi:hypothetical protein